MQKQEKKNLGQKLQSIPREAIFLLVLLSLVLPLLHPLLLPITVANWTKASFAQVQNLKAGDVVFVGFEPHPVTFPEQGIAAQSIIYHVFHKPVKIVFFSIYPTGQMYYESTIKRSSVPADKKYGVDYVYLGYIAGGEVAAAGIADDIHKTVTVDYYKTPLDELPMMKDINGAKDGKLLIFCAYEDTRYMYIRQWAGKYGIAAITTDQTGHITEDMVYYTNNILKGIVCGSRGGAEYDLLVGRATLTIAQMDSQSAYHILALILIVIGNVGYFLEKRGTKNN